MAKMKAFVSKYILQSTVDIRFKNTPPSFQKSINSVKCITNHNNSSTFHKNSSTVKNEDPDKSDTASTVCLEDRNEDIQCNEISSSDESEGPEPQQNLKRSSRPRKHPQTPKLSRELSALQLTEGQSPRGQGRTRSSSENNR